MLIAVDGEGNVFQGGSRNDTMVGDAEDYFDGGSGRNETIVSVSEPAIGVSFRPISNPNYCLVDVELTDFAPHTTYDVTLNFGGYRVDRTMMTDDNGHAFGTPGGTYFRDVYVQVSSNGIMSEGTTINCAS